MMKKFGSLVLIVLMVFSLSFLPGCAGGQGATPGAVQTQDSAVTIAWKTLMTDKTLYDTTFTALAALDKQGKLPAATKAKVIDLGNKYMTAHNAAVSLLLADKQPNLTNVATALKAFTVAAAVLGVK